MNIGTQTKIIFFQNRVLKIFFRSLDETAKIYSYKQCSKLLKFKLSKNLVLLQNCLFMYKLEQDKELAKTFAGLTCMGEIHKCNTRSV